ncbi:hypothetical protein ACHAXR_003701, partial [Thalassiosira sp. AJA248-18]
MGNTVIASILFQPPSPPNKLAYLSNSTTTTNGTEAADNSKAAALAKKRTQNITVNYLWLYSTKPNESPTLIPAIHITHNDTSCGGPMNANNTTNTPLQTNSKMYTLLYSHGNAEDLGLISSFLVDLARLLQINVLCYDYSGYGISTDEVAVSEFYKCYGQELEAWTKNVCGGYDGSWGEVCAKSNGRRCCYSNELFVAPVVAPSPSPLAAVAGAGVDSLNDGSGRENELAVNGVSGQPLKEAEDDDNGAFDFTNTCNWAHDPATTEDAEDLVKNDPPAADQQPPPQQQSKNDINPSSTNNNKKNPTQLLRHLLTQHSWTSPLPSETNCYTNIQSAFNYLTTVERVPHAHVILYGKSVGSGPTCWL